MTEYDRTLDNGGHIHRESHGKVFRDRQGRMRTESWPPAVQSGSERYDRITINDPVRQVIVYLNCRSKTATILNFGETAPGTAVSADKLTKSKQKATFHVGGQSALGNGQLDALGVPNVSSGQANPPSASPVQAMGTTRSSVTAPISPSVGAATIAPLGTRTIEGVTATGTRTARTIVAGTMGNDKAIVSTSDAWVSSDLKVTVLAETDDGQAGRSTIRLVNIVRGEPNPALFQIPPDYTVIENAAVASRRP